MKNEKQIVEFIKSGKSVTDIAILLTMTDVYPTKAEAKAEIEKLIEIKDLQPPKKVSKSGSLKEWFLAQPNPKEVTPEAIKAQCESLEMKGGSVAYYVNAYKLAIDLANQLAG